MSRHKYASPASSTLGACHPIIIRFTQLDGRNYKREWSKMSLISQMYLLECNEMKSLLTHVPIFTLKPSWSMFVILCMSDSLTDHMPAVPSLLRERLTRSCATVVVMCDGFWSRVGLGSFGLYFSPFRSQHFKQVFRDPSAHLTSSNRHWKPPSVSWHYVFFLDELQWITFTWRPLILACYSQFASKEHWGSEEADLFSRPLQMCDGLVFICAQSWSWRGKRCKAVKLKEEIHQRGVMNLVQSQPGREALWAKRCGEFWWSRFLCGSNGRGVCVCVCLW